MATKTTATKSTALKQKASSFAKKLLKLLSFEDFKLKVTTDADQVVNINIEASPEDSGMIIGYHGETISSLQLIMSLIINKDLDQWCRISVNINDYRERREESLIEMAKNTAQRVNQDGEETVMPPMNSFDRRIVHLALAGKKGIKTESVGEGKERRLVVYPQSKSSQE